MDISDVLELGWQRFDDAIYSVLTGSHVYNLNTEKSDFDVKVALTPSIEKLVWEESQKGQITKVEDIVDIQYMPLAHMVKQGLNAKFPFIECWVSPYFLTYEKNIHTLRELFANYLPMNPKGIINSCRGMSTQLWSDALKNEDKFYKKAASAYWFLLFMMNYIETGKIKFQFETAIKSREIKLGQVERQHILMGWEAINSFANNVLFSDYDTKQYADCVISKDKTHTKLYKDLTNEIKGLTVDICRSNA